MWSGHCGQNRSIVSVERLAIGVKRNRHSEGAYFSVAQKQTAPLQEESESFYDW